MCIEMLKQICINLMKPYVYYITPCSKTIQSIDTAWLENKLNRR